MGIFRVSLGTPLLGLSFVKQKLFAYTLEQLKCLYNVLFHGAFFWLMQNIRYLWHGQCACAAVRNGSFPYVGLFVPHFRVGVENVIFFLASGVGCSSSQCDGSQVKINSSVKSMIFFQHEHWQFLCCGPFFVKAYFYGPSKKKIKVIKNKTFTLDRELLSLVGILCMFFRFFSTSWPVSYCDPSH